MVAQGIDDCEGDLLAAVRRAVGDSAVVGATFDPHCHFTRRCADALDVAIAFKEFPHTDMLARARELVDLSVRAARGEAKPRISVFDCRMIDLFPTTERRMRAFVDRILALEKAEPEVLSISVVHGFLAGDVPEMGTKVVVVTDDAPEKGAALARELGLELFAMRGGTRMPVLEPADALDQLRDAPGGPPLLVADVWDNPGGGMAGDSTALLRAVRDRGIGDAALASIWDPTAVQFCFAAGVGARIPLRFGAKSGPGLGEPVDAMATIVGLNENGAFEFSGSTARPGRCAGIRLDDGMEVVLSANRVQAYSPALFRCVDIEPRGKSLLVVKSTNHFRAAFAELSERVLYVDSGAPYPHDPRVTPYRKTRPRHLADRRRAGPRGVNSTRAIGLPRLFPCDLRVLSPQDASAAIGSPGETRARRTRSPKAAGC